MFVRACLGARLLPQQTFRRVLTASVDSCAEIKIECPFSAVTKSGRAWRKMPESDARIVVKPQTASTGLRHPSFNHSRVYLRHRSRKTVS